MIKNNIDFLTHLQEKLPLKGSSQVEINNFNFLIMVLNIWYELAIESNLCTSVGQAVFNTP